MGDGLQKLTEYLNQTRRQAELAIDTLSTEVLSLRQQNEELQLSFTEVEQERDYYKNAYEQLKLENSKKYRLQERDDWKALVESVQKDRGRLQNECVRLQCQVDELTAQTSFLQQENAQLSEIISTTRDANHKEGDDLDANEGTVSELGAEQGVANSVTNSHSSSTSAPSPGAGASSSSSSSSSSSKRAPGATPTPTPSPSPSPYSSPSKPRSSSVDDSAGNANAPHGSPSTSTSASASASVKQLQRIEVEALNNQILAERRQMEMERQEYVTQIAALHEEIMQLKHIAHTTSQQLAMHNSSNGSNSNSNSNSNSSSGGSYHSSGNVAGGMTSGTATSAATAAAAASGGTTAVSTVVGSRGSGSGSGSGGGINSSSWFGLFNSLFSFAVGGVSMSQHSSSQKQLLKHSSDAVKSMLV